jgi:F0F1-type ATP synthase membrane subunit c/vacuolar-type H+-ATPase subunit K
MRASKACSARSAAAWAALTGLGAGAGAGFADAAVIGADSAMPAEMTTENKIFRGLHITDRSWCWNAVLCVG